MVTLGGSVLDFSCFRCNLWMVGRYTHILAVSLLNFALSALYMVAKRCCKARWTIWSWLFMPPFQLLSYRSFLLNQLPSMVVAFLHKHPDQTHGVSQSTPTSSTTCKHAYNTLHMYIRLVWASRLVSLFVFCAIVDGEELLPLLRVLGNVKGSNGHKRFTHLWKTITGDNKYVCLVACFTWPVF